MSTPKDGKMEKFDVAEREEAIFRKHMEMARLEL